MSTDFTSHRIVAKIKSEKHIHNAAIAFLKEETRGLPECSR